MKQHLLLAIFLISSFGLFGEDQKQDKPTIDLYGFIRNAYYLDSYAGTESTFDQFYLLPIYAGTDANGDDYNQRYISNISAVCSRLGVKVKGPELFGAKSSAQMEFDFGGLTNAEPSLFRIRHANFHLNWDNSMMIVGQYWHPFWGDGDFPQVGALNTGAPFQPFNRSPQIRYDYKIKDFTLSGAAVYQNQYTSKSLMASTNGIQATRPLRWSGTPEIVVMLKYRKKAISLGAGIEYNSILPTDRVMNPTDSLTYMTNKKNNSYGIVAYGVYKKEKLSILIKGMYGQNLTHLVTPGGYGVKNVKSNGEYEYTNYNNYTAFINVLYGEKWQGGLMAGYGGNLGTTDPLADMGNGKAQIAGSFTSTNSVMQSMYRVAPQVSLNVKNFKLTAEYEMTTAEYGSTKIGGVMDLNDGLFDKTTEITNHRLLLMMMYFF